MDGWIFKPGYPLVSARHEGRELVLTQQRFTYLPEPLDGAEPSGEPGQRWRVPVQIRTQAGATSSVTRLLLSAGEARVPGAEALAAVVFHHRGPAFSPKPDPPHLLWWTT